MGWWWWWWRSFRDAREIGHFRFQTWPGEGAAEADSEGGGGCYD